MSSFGLKIDPRETQYARLAGNVLKVLKAAVAHRVADGVSQTEIADRIGMDKSRLSRILNGRVKNVTVRTVSDILWAAEHEPEEFSADPLEDISPNYRPMHLRGPVLMTTGFDTCPIIRVIGSSAISDTAPAVVRYAAPAEFRLVGVDNG